MYICTWIFMYLSLSPSQYCIRNTFTAAPPHTYLPHIPHPTHPIPRNLLFKRPLSANSNPLTMRLPSHSCIAADFPVADQPTPKSEIPDSQVGSSATSESSTSTPESAKPELLSQRQPTPESRLEPAPESNWSTPSWCFTR